ncbi:hypothetical protein FIBSPDRAFT_894539 [Athelia psychrophila]|uniref:YWTD domain-containing protein n=1 Tax=Athelia psychrophila TaxID=1759441 RepID=A0A166FTD0_9AGAM|nr:hypothetical protein FIBSPDRAFT_894539 [Fibularhizoctonia sp. CBS 109695]
MSTPKHEHAGRLIILDLGAGLVDTAPGKGQIYVTCMGNSTTTNEGHLMDAAGDGTGVEVIEPNGAMFTLKQLVIDTTTERLYWADREGMRVMHWRFQGPTGPYPPRQHRHLRRPNPASRTDIQALYAHLPELIDLELDAATQALYWTDRGDPPLGNTLNRADVSSPLEPNTNVTNDAAAAKGPSKDTVVAGKFHEAIGLSLDLPRHRTFVADLNGSVYAGDLDSGRKEVLIEDAGTVTGIVYCEA